MYISLLTHAHELLFCFPIWTTQLKNQITIDPLEEVDCILNYNDIIMYGGSGPHKSHITSL